MVLKDRMDDRRSTALGGLLQNPRTYLKYAPQLFLAPLNPSQDIDFGAYFRLAIHFSSFVVDQLWRLLQWVSESSKRFVRVFDALCQGADDETMDGAPFDDDEPLWTGSDAHARTYLWSLSLQATHFFFDPNPSLSGPRKFDSYSAPPSPTHPTFIELMKDPLALGMGDMARVVKPEIVSLSSPRL